MARAGVGVDMLDIGRMEKAMRRRPGFARRVFTPSERRYCERVARPAQRYAACVAARGAVLRALGVGFADGVGRHDVSVGQDSAGRPVAILSGRAAEVARERGVSEVALSLSFTHEVAVANAVAMGEGTRPPRETTSDARAELRASFRDARSVLDELERIQRDNEGDTVDKGSQGSRSVVGPMPSGTGVKGE